MRNLSPPHLLDPLPDGSVCKLGLCEGRLPNAKIWGHQVEGGAGASRHPLHSLQGASQCVHVKGRASCLPLQPPPPPPSQLSRLCLSAVLSQVRRMAPRAPATSDVTGASYDNVVWRGLHTNLFSHKQQFWIFGKKKALLPLLRIVFHSNYGSLLYYFLLW